MVVRTLFFVLVTSLGACTSDTFGGSDADTDAGGDAASEAASDGGMPTCALGVPGQCAGSTCSMDQECCVTSSQAQCRSTGNTCTGETLRCLGANACTASGDGGTPLCCLTNAVITPGCPAIVTTGSSQCVGSGLCGGTGGTRICETDSDCPKQSCVRAVFANNTSFVFGICQ